MKSPCLDDASLDDYVHARLTGEELVAVETHLDECPECTAMVSVLAGGEQPSPALLSPGAVLGRYVIQERLGAGAMGVVHVAHDPALGRRVALKVVRGAGSPEAQRRMLREAQAMAQVAHPNVVAIYDVGRYADDSVYLALELVEGETLRTWLATERTPKDVLDVLAQAGRGLAAAHDAGLVHRDFKPENVLVGRDGRVRVTDFGLARLAPMEAVGPDDGGAASVAALTRTGALLGTPSYMAPELLAPGAPGAPGAEATWASDVYAFGVTLYEATFGARPFVGATIAELRERMQGALPRATPRVPSARVTRVVTRALATAPADRYASMRALLVDLAPAAPRTWPRWLAGGILTAAAIALVATRAVPHPVDRCAAGSTLAARTLTPARQARITAAFGGTALPYASAAASLVLRQLDTYAEAWTQAYRTTCEATEVRHDQSSSMLDARMECLEGRLGALNALTTTLETAGPEAVAHAGEAVASLPEIGACADRTSLQAREPRPGAAARGPLEALEAGLARTRSAMATGVGSAMLSTDAREAVAVADALGYRPVISEAHLLLATLLRRAGFFADGIREANAALLAAEASHDDRAAVLAWLELLAIRGEEGNTTALLDAAGPALAAAARLGTPEDLEASVLFERGVAHTSRGDLDDAERDLAGALERRTRALGEKHLDVSRTRSALGNVARARGELDRALALHRQALAADADLLGEQHPALARHDHNIAGVLRLQGKLGEALEAYARALDLEKEGLGPRHLAVGRTENSIGLVWLERGDPKTARVHFEAAHDILLHHPDLGLVLHNLGLTEAAEGDHAAAMRRYDEALVIDRAALTKDNPEIAAVLARRQESARALRPARARARAPSPSPAARQISGGYAPAQTWDTAQR